GVAVGVFVDRHPFKRQAALDAGALAASDGNAPDVAQQIVQALGGKPARSVIDLVGAPSTTSAAFDCLGKGGKMIIVGLFGGATSWPITMIPIKAVSILGSYVGNLTELKALMDLVKAGRVKPIPVTRYGLEQADEVLTALREGKVTGRAVLTA